MSPAPRRTSPAVGAARELGLAQLPLLLRDGLAEARGVLRPERLGGRGLLSGVASFGLILGAPSAAPPRH